MSSDQDFTMLTAALNYASQGYAVFPCHNITANGNCSCGKPEGKGHKSGKHPRTEHGHLDATTDLATIEAWWTQYPDANIGMATGKINGTVIVDVDTSGEKKGAETLAALCDKHGTEWLNTRQARTGSGGTHLLFKYPDGVDHTPSGTYTFGKDIDCRADGGLIIVPPSNHISGGTYEWLNDLEPQPMPDWLLDIALAGKATKTQPNEGEAPRCSGVNPLTIKRLKAAMPWIAADEYDVWLKVGAAMKFAGLKVEDWAEWSKRSDKFDEGVCEEKWESFRRDSGEVVTLATIFHMAKGAGWPADGRWSEEEMDAADATINEGIKALGIRQGGGEDVRAAANDLLKAHCFPLEALRNWRLVAYNPIKAALAPLAGLGKSDFDRVVKQTVETQALAQANTLEGHGGGLHLERKENGQVHATTWNAVAVLLGHSEWVGVFRHNDFSQSIEKALAPPVPKGAAGEMHDVDIIEFGLWMNEKYGVEFCEKTRYDAIEVAARRNSYNPAQDRLRQYHAEWDGEPRLEGWLTRWLNADPSAGSEYLCEVGKRWMIGVVARVMRPGCKRDDVLSLIGPQGFRKSSLAQAISDAIVPGSFVETPNELGTDEARRRLQGCVIAELGEMASLRKSEIDAVKQYLSAGQDRMRPLYGKHSVTYYRTVSFIGTGNEQEFLKDPTGNRRFWPVTVTRVIDMDLVTPLIPQLLGEAMDFLEKGEPWHITNEVASAQAEAIRDSHMEEDPWERGVWALVTRRAQVVNYEGTVAGLAHTSTNILRTLMLSVSGTRLATRGDEMRLANILKRYGYAKRQITGADGGRMRVWEPTDKTPASWLPVTGAAVEATVEAVEAVEAVEVKPPLANYTEEFAKLAAVSVH